MAPKRKIPDGSSFSKKAKSEPVDKPYYTTKNKLTLLPKEKSVQCYVRLTISSIGEFRDEKMNSTENALKGISFIFDPSKTEYDSYHEGNTMFMAGFYIFEGNFNVIDIVDKLWDIYAKNHSDLDEIRFSIETTHRILYFDWSVFRFSGNNGIMRDLRQVLQYGYYGSQESFDKDVSKKKVKLIKMQNKERPFCGKFKIYNITNIKDILKYCDSYASVITTSERESYYLNIKKVFKKHAAYVIYRAWHRCYNDPLYTICKKRLKKEYESLTS